ncbi:UDP-galactose 4-epimerase-like protein [Dissophora ornata]|nr:hypothetical protein BGZ58_002016 [Dissophora ornata]KAI8603967.1 UDP-galactose 4-epimerase-like protein [Dissophora ornata]
MTAHNQETILVTGGAGFIGSHTVVQLLNLGKRLVIIDNLCNSSEEALHRALALAHNKKGSLVFHKVDLLDGEALQRVFDLYTFSACIHFAGLKAVGESAEIPLGYYQTNITGTLNLVQLLQKHQCRNVIFSSSATVYGLPSSDKPIKEDAPTGAMNPYGRTKQYIEEILRDTADSEPGKWNIILLRYFNPVGAHESGRIGEDPDGTPNNLMPYVAQVAIGRRPVINVFGNDYNTKDGTGVRDYIHIQDLARGHVAALEKIEAITRSRKTLGCVPYNLGTGTGYSVKEMINSMSEAVGHELPYRVIGRRPGDVATVIADPSLAAQELGWKAEKTLSDMCRDLWRWQTQNPEGYAGSESSHLHSIAAPLTPTPGPHSHMTLPTMVTGKAMTDAAPMATKISGKDGRSMPPPFGTAFSPANSPTPVPTAKMAHQDAF